MFMYEDFPLRTYCKIKFKDLRTGCENDSRWLSHVVSMTEQRTGCDNLFVEAFSFSLVSSV